MEAPRVSRFLDPTSAVAAITKHKAEAIKLAREQGAAVREMCRRAKTETPPYEFEELIGKGAYGRVYKGHQLPSRQVVAIKVLDIDSLDYKSVRDFKDESIKDFIHETKVMKQVKDAGAKNINELIEAVSIHSQLWLVCEYCPGGSVRTLVRLSYTSVPDPWLVVNKLYRCVRLVTDSMKSSLFPWLVSWLLVCALSMMLASFIATSKV
jgi:serine/threonine protein kinase